MVLNFSSELQSPLGDKDSCMAACPQLESESQIHCIAAGRSEKVIQLRSHDMHGFAVGLIPLHGQVRGKPFSVD